MYTLNPIYSISIHAPRVGSDCNPGLRSWPVRLFQSTLPVWGATTATSPGIPDGWNFNPRSPCGERRWSRNFEPVEGWISIHAPRVGSDHFRLVIINTILDFNPRSPCGERRDRECTHGRHHAGFQSTLPVWGATYRLSATGARRNNFNPRSPCGERLSNPAWTT